MVPYLGSGLGYRGEIGEQIHAAADEIDFVEVFAEAYMSPDADLDVLYRLLERFPVIPHGVGLSIGSMGPLDEDYLRAVKRVSDLTATPYFSDHLCVTKVPGIDLGHLTPLVYSRELLDSVTAKVDAVQQHIGKPLILENVTHIFEPPASELTECEFFSRLAEATGCGVLLDVANIYINSVNHYFDPKQFVSEMPLDHVVQVHLAGGVWLGGYLADRHSHPVPEEVWDLFGHVCQVAPVKGVILEQDENFTEFMSLTEQVWRARGILREASGWAAAERPGDGA